jgi:hypothetical protein
VLRRAHVLLLWFPLPPPPPLCPGLTGGDAHEQLMSNPFVGRMLMVNPDSLALLSELYDAKANLAAAAAGRCGIRCVHHRG